MADVKSDTRRPSRAEIFARDFVDGFKRNRAEIKNKSLEALLHQADVMSRGARPVAMASGVGSYYSGYRSGGALFPYGVSNAGQSRVLNHQRIRLNARDAYHDSPQARAIVDRYADSVAGVGLVRESSPRADILGITLERAKEWGRDVDTRFDLWCRDKRSHRSETMTFYQGQRLYQIFQHRDNDIFKRLYYSADMNLQNPLQWEFIDPDQLIGQSFTGTYGEYMDNAYDGIIRDDRGRETAYNINVRSGQGKFKTVKVQRIGPKSRRVFMLHGFNPEYAGQGRGYSRLGHAIQWFENITDFKSAQIIKAIQQASIIAVNENKDFDPTNLFKQSLTTFGQGAVAKKFGSNPESSDATLTTTETEPTRCYQVPEYTSDQPGMWVMNAGQGDSLKPFAGNAPADSFDKFVDAFMYYLSASSGIPLEVVLMRFSNNYSASRGTLILFWRTVMQWRQEWAADCGDPVFEMWLAGEIAAGRIQAPGWSDPVLRAAWLHGSWRGAPMPDIDPSKTAKARRENLSMGLTTGAREARDLNGSEFDANKAQLEYEYGDEVPPPWEKSSGDGGDGNPDAQAIADAVIDELKDNGR